MIPMEEIPNDVIVLSAIQQGAKKFGKMKKKTRLDDVELNALLERLENNGLVRLIEKKGFFGPKKELVLTEKGTKELEERRFELQQHWDQMVTLWKSGDKEKLQQQMDNDKSLFPAMMFMGIMDIMMFSSIMSFMGLAMASYIPDQQMYDSGSANVGQDGGNDMGRDGGGFGQGDFSQDTGGFDVNF